MSRGIRPILAISGQPRERRSPEGNADLVILIHREEMYEKDSPRAGEVDLIVAKHRYGPTATIITAFQGHYGRFVDMAQDYPCSCGISDSVSESHG
jgi:replicative DNA helicase